MRKFVCGVCGYETESQKTPRCCGQPMRKARGTMKGSAKMSCCGCGQAEKLIMPEVRI